MFRCTSVDGTRGNNHNWRCAKGSGQRTGSVGDPTTVGCMYRTPRCARVDVHTHTCTAYVRTNRVGDEMSVASSIPDPEHSAQTTRTSRALDAGTGSPPSLESPPNGAGIVTTHDTHLTVESNKHVQRQRHQSDTMPRAPPLCGRRSRLAVPPNRASDGGNLEYGLGWQAEPSGSSLLEASHFGTQLLLEAAIVVRVKLLHTALRQGVEQQLRLRILYLRSACTRSPMRLRWRVGGRAVTWQLSIVSLVRALFVCERGGRVDWLRPTLPPARGGVRE